MPANAEDGLGGTVRCHTPVAVTWWAAGQGRDMASAQIGVTGLAGRCGAPFARFQREWHALPEPGFSARWGVVMPPWLSRPYIASVRPAAAEGRGMPENVCGSYLRPLRAVSAVEPRFSRQTPILKFVTVKSVSLGPGRRRSRGKRFWRLRRRPQQRRSSRPSQRSTEGRPFDKQANPLTRSQAHSAMLCGRNEP